MTPLSQELIQQQENLLFSEIQYLIRLLYVTHDPYMKNLTLFQLWNQVEQLQFLHQLQGYSLPQTAYTPSAASIPAASVMAAAPTQPQMSAAPSAASAHTLMLPQSQTTQPAQALQSGQASQLVQAPQQTFTREQLAQYDGRNGRAAYVAVNGTVYDVTNNAAWSAATHFGLSAGKDLTQPFASCHAAEQWILNTLTPVGRLVD